MVTLFETLKTFQWFFFLFSFHFKSIFCFTRKMHLVTAKEQKKNHWKTKEQWSGSRAIATASLKMDQKCNGLASLLLSIAHRQNINMKQEKRDREQEQMFCNHVKEQRTIYILISSFGCFFHRSFRFQIFFFQLPFEHLRARQVNSRGRKCTNLLFRTIASKSRNESKEKANTEEKAERILSILCSALCGKTKSDHQKCK